MPHIRPIQIEKDAAEIAALVRSSFRPWLERENIDYLDHLEKAGKDARSFPFWTGLTGFPYTMTGVVCTDETGRIIGIISTYPFFLHGEKCSLIANVCVAPEHRNKGIAGHMISEIAQMQRQNGIYGLYLQTRMEQAGLENFYKANGFSTTDYRETWILPGKSNFSAGKTALRLETVPAADMDEFRSRMDSRYPETIRWNLDYNEELFQPGMMHDLLSRFTFSGNRFVRVINNSGTVTAWAAYQNLKESMDALWFVPAGNLSGNEITDVLCALRNNYHRSKALKLDIPAGENTVGYREAGFVYQQTLAWMWRAL